MAVAVGVGGAVVGAGASYAGSKKQAGAAKDAANLSMDQFRTLNAQQQPYIQSGYGALGKLNTLMGLSPNPNQRRMPQPVQGGQMNAQGAPPGTYTNGPYGMPGRIPQQIPYTGQQGQQGPQGGMPNLKLQQILQLRAMHGDTQAQEMLQRIS